MNYDDNSSICVATNFKLRLAQNLNKQGNNRLNLHHTKCQRKIKLKIWYIKKSINSVLKWVFKREPKILYSENYLAITVFN